MSSLYSVRFESIQHPDKCGTIFASCAGKDRSVHTRFIIATEHPLHHWMVTVCDPVIERYLFTLKVNDPTGEAVRSFVKATATVLLGENNIGCWTG